MLLEELAQECVGNIGGVLPSGKRHGMIPSLVGFNFSGIFFLILVVVALWPSIFHNESVLFWCNKKVVVLIINTQASKSFCGMCAILCCTAFITIISFMV